MLSLILYFDNLNMVNDTIEDMCDKTHIGNVDNIIICNDSGELLEQSFNGLVNDKTVVLDSSHIGRAKAWAIAAQKIEQGKLIFIGGITKFGAGWLPPLLDSLTDTNMVTPQVCLLDVNIWQSLSNKWERFGWRWDFEITNKLYLDDNQTPTVSCYCFAITKQRYEQLGGFDVGMDSGSGEDIELSLRNWLMGGSCIVAKLSMIATAVIRKPASASLRNISRIIQAWLPEYEENAKLYYLELPDAGKIANLLTMEKDRVRTNKDLLIELQPELFGVFELRKIVRGKSIALIAPGASFDYLNRSTINRNEVLIGIDYMGLVVDCDYVITDSVNVIKELQLKYKNDQFLLPKIVSNRILGRYESADDICPGCYIFELKQQGQLDISINPPFVNIDNISIAAINVALFMQPAIINVYGLDYRLLNGASHASSVGYYDDGLVMPDTDSTKSRYNYNEYVLHKLGDLAITNNTPIIRINHL